VATLVRSGVPASARNGYLAAATLSAATLLTGTLLLDHGSAPLVLALLLTGFAVKLALVPVFVWLPNLAARTPAALLGLVVSVVDLAGFAELAALRDNAPWLFSPQWPWLTVALLSVAGGVLLALGQRDVVRMLAFATVSTSGLLVLGVCVAQPFGTAGAWAVACADAIGMALLFSAVTAAESDGSRLTLSSRGVARRHPLAAAGFVIGSLTALGVPFSAGFAGHWRLYAAALHVGWAALALLAVTTVLYVLAYSRVIATAWWGSPDGVEPVPHDAPRTVSVWASEPSPLAAALLVLLVAVVGAGLVPAVLENWGTR
jgi:formate hydrogenlyase subunit 3/multisubunit Na+/H+ antiporter MnhD subunit